eukprot:scaffold261_cov336-Pavlova_lutheri.AAC.47
MYAHSSIRAGRHAGRVLVERGVSHRPSAALASCDTALARGAPAEFLLSKIVAIRFLARREGSRWSHRSTDHAWRALHLIETWLGTGAWIASDMEAACGDPSESY